MDEFSEQVRTTMCEVIDWYVNESELDDFDLEATEIIKEQGVNGKYQARIVIEACERYEQQTNPSNEKRQLIQSFKGDLEQIYFGESENLNAEYEPTIDHYDRFKQLLTSGYRRMAVVVSRIKG